MLRIRVAVMFVSLALLGAAYFQDKDKGKKDDDPPAKLKGTLPQNYKKLGLTDKQVQEVYKIQADYKAKMDDLQKKLDKLRGERNEAYEKVLSAEQKKRLQEIKSGEKSGK